MEKGLGSCLCLILSVRANDSPLFFLAHLIVTTVPLTVCYGALNLWVLTDISNFAPYVCDRAIAGEHEGPESTVTSSAYFRGLMFALFSLLSIIVPIPSFICPFASSQVPSFVPQERSQ